MRLPHGSVTFLFTDIEGSTQLNRELDTEYPHLLMRYHRAVRSAVAMHHGVLIQTQGDGCFAAFADAAEGVQAAFCAQLEFVSWHQQGHRAIKVRMGLHTGRAMPVDGDYSALAVHRAARVSSAAHGGQILCSAATLALASAALGDPRPLSAEDLGPFILKDFPEPEHLYQIVHPDLPSEFPPLRASSPKLHNLPIRRTAFIGRERDKTEIKKLLESDQLLTLVGSGGAGKTRLAIEVAGELASKFSDGAWLVELAGVTDDSLVANAVAQALAVQLTSDRAPLQTLSDELAEKQLLIVLDNCEHLLDGCAAVADQLLSSCPGVSILATSRERIGIPAEVVWRIPSMGVPAPGKDDIAELVDYDATRLFIERASHTFFGFSLDSDSASAVAEICRRLDGIPLAIELAAAPRRLHAPAPDRGAARRPFPAPERGEPSGAAETQDIAGGTRMELRTSGRARAQPVRLTRCFLRRLDRRSGRLDMRSRRCGLCRSSARPSRTVLPGGANH